MAALEIVKKVSNAVLYKDSGGQLLIRIDNVRFSHPYIGTPSEDENDDGMVSKKYRVVAMLPKATHTAAKDLVKEVIQKLIKDNDAKIPSDKWFLSNGDDKEDANYEAHWLVTASDGRIRPAARDQKGQLMDDIAKIDDKFYGGCWGCVLIRPWYFSGKSKNSIKTFPKRISAGLNGVVFLRDDKPFGSGRIDDTDAWDDLPESTGGNDAFDDDDDL